MRCEQVQALNYGNNGYGYVFIGVGADGEPAELGNTYLPSPYLVGGQIPNNDADTAYDILVSISRMIHDTQMAIFVPAPYLLIVRSWGERRATHEQFLYVYVKHQNYENKIIEH